MFEATRNLAPDEADQEREETYQLAQDVDAQLAGMVGALKDLVDQVNGPSSVAGGG
ncbi:unnamed protein product, partial [Discosporangium mesarthrocarpum]